ncbi:Peroxisomal membrane protein PAS20 [Basidiobolus ranarum]|uniref:Peroxisomal membrane protein PEX13 n=1 Tax=Basidiobolus ranarum TaxID=34480 RepID=A0ABR2VSM5_9FUNG
MASPPKPWEKNPQSSTVSTMSSTNASTNSSTGANPPLVPERTSMTGYGATAGSYGSGAMGGYRSGYGGYGAGGYSSGGYGSSYGSRYGSSGYGGGLYGSSGYGSSGYGSGYGGYGGGYGSYGGMSSGYGGYGSRYGGGYGGMGGMGMGPNGPEGGPGLLNTVESTVQPTFQAIDGIVNAFGGCAHMLESTFMATHSSFMAMVGVVDQFGRLRTHLGQVLSVFALIRTVRNLFYRMIGKNPPVNPEELNVSDFSGFEQKKSSKRPVIIFLLVVLGVPFLMHRLIMTLAKRQQAKGMIPATNVPGQPGPLPQDVEFARAMYDFNGDNNVELSLKRGDVIAVLSKTDLNGQPSDWWRGRLRSGQVGIFPSNYVEILDKKSSSGPSGNPPPNSAPISPVSDNIGDGNDLAEVFSNAAIS